MPTVSRPRLPGSGTDTGSSEAKAGRDAATSARMLAMKVYESAILFIVFPPLGTHLRRRNLLTR